MIIHEHLTTTNPDNFRNNITLAEAALQCAREAATDEDAYAFLQTALPLITGERNRLDDELRKI